MHPVQVRLSFTGYLRYASIIHMIIKSPFRETREETLELMLKDANYRTNPQTLYIPKLSLFLQIRCFP